MPLLKQTLQAQIEAILVEMSERKDSPEQARKDLAEKLATAIHGWIITATVTTPSGPGTIS